MRAFRTSSRGTSIAAVALLHVVIVVALLRAVVLTPIERPKAEEREVIVPLALPNLARASVAPAKGRETRGLTAVPNLTNSPFVSPGAAGEKLGAALFGCTPERMATLPREEREKCERQTGFTYTAFANLPMKLAPPPEKLSNGDIAARYRNTTDPCAIAKMSGTECIYEVLYGKKLP